MKESHAVLHEEGFRMKMKSKWYKLKDLVCFSETRYFSLLSSFFFLPPNNKTSSSSLAVRQRGLL